MFESSEKILENLWAKHTGAQFRKSHSNWLEKGDTGKFINL